MRRNVYNLPFQCRTFVMGNVGTPLRTVQLSFIFKFSLIVCMISRCICVQPQAVVTDIKDIENLTKLLLKNYNVTSGHNGLVSALDDLLRNLKSRTLSLSENNEESNCTAQSSHFNDTLDVSTCNASKKCLATQDMIGLVPNESQSLSGVVSRLCPLMLFQMQLRTCDYSNEMNGVASQTGKTRPSPSEVWGYGILFVTLISCCSLVGVIILPLLNKDLYFVVLMLFEGLAVGSLIGSSIFHLIPQAFSLLGQDAQHDYLWKSLILFGGIYLFYFSEQCMKIIIQIRKKRRNTDPPLDEKIKPLLHPSSSSSSAINGISPVAENGTKVNFLSENGKTENSLTNGNVVNLVIAPNHTYDLTQDSEKHHTGSHSHHDHHVTFEPGQNGVGTVAWMIIFGDGLHNFIDGLSIGAAFSESVLAGISISVAVVCEEFPHELGDFAVLLSAGMSMRQAIVYNFLSACTCYLGLVFGILLGDLTEGSPYILALAGGMFLYISLVDMVGELNEGIREANKSGVCHTLKVLLLQNLGIFIGIIMLFVMARYSELINFDATDGKNNSTLLQHQDQAVNSEHLTIESPNAFGF